jgi:ATP-binding cassette subfamily B protein
VGKLTWFVGPGAGGFGGGRPGAPIEGLPFAGIPRELQRGVDKILKTEPKRPKADESFTYKDQYGSRRLGLIELISKYKTLAVLTLLATILISLLGQAGPKIIEKAINETMLPRHHDVGLLLTFGLIYLVTSILNAIFQLIQVKTTGRLSSYITRDLRIRVFRHIERQSLDYFTEEKAGVIMTRMSSDIENLQTLLRDGLAQIATQSLTMVVITVILFTMNVELATVTILGVVPVLFISSYWFANKSEKAYSIVRDKIASVLADLSENLHGIRVIIASNRQKMNLKAHRQVLGDYLEANNYTARINAIYGPGTQTFGILSQALILSLGGYLVYKHDLSIGALVAFFLYLNRFFQPIQLLVQQFNSFQQGYASIYKLRGLLETKPLIIEKQNAIELTDVVGRVEFQNVTFGYDSQYPVIKDLSLMVEPRKSLAVVGPTGAGKSTLAKLLVRFYDPLSGRILIDDKDIADISLESLRKNVILVPQEPYLFSGTLKDNVRFGRPEATDDEIYEAVKAVGLNELIDFKSEGVDTWVHERGQSLSSGERQLVALARAFLAQPKILILDEATSNLDLVSEERIESALDVVLQARTSILIAHRLNTAIKADCIAVIVDGRLVELGHHDELVGNDGHYRKMYGTWLTQKSTTESEIATAS